MRLVLFDRLAFGSALTLPPWRVQVLLDPYPFGGGVTSLEAFAMCKAVSVLTLTCGAQAMLIPSH